MVESRTISQVESQGTFEMPVTISSGTWPGQQVCQENSGGRAVRVGGHQPRHQHHVQSRQKFSNPVYVDVFLEAKHVFILALCSFKTQYLMHGEMNKLQFYKRIVINHKAQCILRCNLV